MKTITNPKKKILLFCPYPLNTAPSQRLKYEQYLTYLNSCGFKINVYPFFDRYTYKILYQRGYFFEKIFGVLAGVLRRLAQLPLILKADGVYIHLHIIPVGPSFFEWLFLRLSKRTIYDIDDMVHQLRTSSSNKMASWAKSNSRYFLLLKKSNHVITCTPDLDELARKYNDNTTDISSTINTSTYLPINRYKNDHEIIIGWSGSHSTVPYLHLLDEIFTKLANAYEFKLLVMGTNEFNIPGVRVESVLWSDDIEIETLQRMDIGVYPLPNDDWVKGKSGLKALQYMALGLPVVATNVGCNHRVIEHSVTGFLASTSEEWYYYLSKLIECEILRRNIGCCARKKVVDHFSIEANKSKYLQIFKRVYTSGNVSKKY